MSVFPMQVGSARMRLAMVCAAALLSASLVAGCGAGLRPVITPINPSGPAGQPSAYAVVVSNTGSASQGIATVVDYAGDTIMVQAPIGPGPIGFTVDGTGSSGFSLNSDGTLTNFQISGNQPQQKNISFSTLPGAANIVNLYSTAASLFAPDLNGNVTDVLTGFPETFKLAVPVSPTPVMVVGAAGAGARAYSIAQNFTDASGVACTASPRTVGATGVAEAIEPDSFTISARIPLGVCPVFAITSSDFRRVFVLNRGDDTITVINSEHNALNQCTPFLSQTGQLVTCHPSLPLSTAAGLKGANVPAIAGPVYAEYNFVTNQLVVADYDGNAISIIDVTLDQYGNDSPTFGTTYTVPVGTNPAGVTVLHDGSRAYTANQTDGTVSEVNMLSHTLVKTLPVIGHPRTVVSTQNSLFGKVYVAAPDSQYLTIIRTDQDIIDTTVLIQGKPLDVRTTNQNGSSGNAQINSRMPGHGQPCNLPLGQLGPLGSLTLQRCQSQTP